MRSRTETVKTYREASPKPLEVGQRVECRSRILFFWSRTDTGVITSIHDGVALVLFGLPPGSWSWLRRVPLARLMSAGTIVDQRGVHLSDDCEGCRVYQRVILFLSIAIIGFGIALAASGCSLVTEGMLADKPPLDAGADVGAGELEHDGGDRGRDGEGADADAGAPRPDDAEDPTDSAPTAIAAVDVEALTFTEGIVCNPAAVIAHDGAAAGLGRSSSTTIDELDGQSVSACVQVRFERGDTLSVRIVARAAGEACGAACSLCGTGREADVFLDGEYAATIELGGAFLEHEIEAARELAFVTVCRTGQGAARDQVEVDSVDALRW